VKNSYDQDIGHKTENLKMSTTKYAVAFTIEQIEYLLAILEPIAETDQDLDTILQSFDESMELDSSGNFIPFIA
jgi:hypothetical protein